MDMQPLEVYAADSNYAVVKPPGRHYPGAVIQGDGLRHRMPGAWAARHAQTEPTTPSTK